MKALKTSMDELQGDVIEAENGLLECLRNPSADTLRERVAIRNAARNKFRKAVFKGKGDLKVTVTDTDKERRHDLLLEELLKTVRGQTIEKPCGEEYSLVARPEGKPPYFFIIDGISYCESMNGIIVSGVRKDSRESVMMPLSDIRGMFREILLEHILEIYGSLELSIP